MPRNELQTLADELRPALARALDGLTVEIKLDAPDPGEHTWWLDVFGIGRHVTIEWRARKPDRQDQFGVSLVDPEIGVDDDSDEWLSHAGTINRVIELLSTGE
jgi:hypothetical protein